VAGDNTTVVKLAIAGATTSTGGTPALACTGGLSRVVASGVATFGGCRLDLTGTYRLIVTSSPPYASATTDLLTVSVGPPARLVFVVQPGTAVAGAVFPVAPVVALQDSGGNTVSSGATAFVALGMGSNPWGGTLGCASGPTVLTLNGLASFTGCRIDRAGGRYTLTATPVSVTPSWPVASATSNPFTVIAGPSALSIMAWTPVITWGQTAGLTIMLSPASAGRLVQVQASGDGASWSTIATLTTDAVGAATLLYRPPTNRWYRAVFAGAPDLQSSTSIATRVVVRQILILRPTTLGSVSTVAVGTTVPLVIVVRPARPELPAVQVTRDIYQWTNGRWVRIDRSVATGTGGTAVMPWTFSTPGRYYVRAMANPTPFNANSAWSPVERYNVK